MSALLPFTRPAGHSGTWPARPPSSVGYRTIPASVVNTGTFSQAPKQDRGHS
ncbi:MAG: hypothetical protein OJF50_005760 [Nitrospira sp.]|nr:hypothetical protein [Nitrospira sp.]